MAFCNPFLFPDDTSSDSTARGGASMASDDSVNSDDGQSDVSVGGIPDGAYYVLPAQGPRFWAKRILARPGHLPGSSTMIPLNEMHEDNSQIVELMRYHDCTLEIWLNGDQDRFVSTYRHLNELVDQDSLRFFKKVDLHIGLDTKNEQHTTLVLETFMMGRYIQQLKIFFGFEDGISQPNIVLSASIATIFPRIICPNPVIIDCWWCELAPSIDMQHGEGLGYPDGTTDGVKKACTFVTMLEAADATRLAANNGTIQALAREENLRIAREERALLLEQIRAIELATKDEQVSGAARDTDTTAS